MKFAGAQTTSHKGINGRWCNVPTAEEVAKYDGHATLELEADCVHRLAIGEPVLRAFRLRFFEQVDVASKRRLHGLIH